MYEHRFLYGYQLNNKWKIAITFRFQRSMPHFVTNITYLQSTVQLKIIYTVGESEKSNELSPTLSLGVCQWLYLEIKAFQQILWLNFSYSTFCRLWLTNTQLCPGSRIRVNCLTTNLSHILKVTVFSCTKNTQLTDVILFYFYTWHY